MKKHAFTLAEGLITLGIIGVVAAMTLPMLVAKYQKMVTVNKLKKMWNVFSNAYQLAVNDYGDPANWSYPNNSNMSDYEFFDKYFSPYMNMKYVKRKSYIVHNYNGLDAGYSQIVLPSYNSIGSVDGVCIVPWSNNQYMTFNIDLNCEKPPNVIGKDVFGLAEFWGFTRNSGKLSIPELSVLNRAVDKEVARQAFINMCKAHSFRSGGQIRCLAVIVYDGWKIKDDYPW